MQKYTVYFTSVISPVIKGQEIHHRINMPYFSHRDSEKGNPWSVSIFLAWTGEIGPLFLILVSVLDIKDKTTLSNVQRDKLKTMRTTRTRRTRGVTSTNSGVAPTQTEDINDKNNVWSILSRVWRTISLTFGYLL